MLQAEADAAQTQHSAVNMTAAETEMTEAKKNGQVEAATDGQADADFDKMTIDEALRRLECDKNGLTTAEAEIRLQKFGPNKLEETKKNPVIEYLVCRMVLF
jgi:magnesium-transporting ATPase (P-type)